MAIKLHSFELYTRHLCCEEGMQFYCPSHTLCNNSLLILFHCFSVLKALCLVRSIGIQWFGWNNGLTTCFTNLLSLVVRWKGEPTESFWPLGIYNRIGKKMCKKIVCKVTSSIIAIARNSSPNIFCEKKSKWKKLGSVRPISFFSYQPVPIYTDNSHS